MAMTPKVLLLEGIHPIAKQRLEDSGFEVDLHKGSWSEEELLEGLSGYHAIGIRSKTKITKSVVEKHASSLWAVGAFCIGTNQIDLERANLAGIPAFNAPYANTRSVAELVIAEMISLARQLGDRSMLAHRGEWRKSAVGAHEVRGKTLGIIGYGHIGSQLSVMAEAIGLTVIYYDIVKKLPLGNARSVDYLEDLLAESDFVSLHVPETPQTRNMIKKRQLDTMKKGAYLINASRGVVIDIPALVEALKSGHLGGAAVDVFPSEPKSNDEKFSSELQGIENVILTPHIGGSTEEAQEAIGAEVSEALIQFFRHGTTMGSVNFPRIALPPVENSQRILNVHQNVPGVLGETNSIVSSLGANIKAQYLSTDPSIGYLVMDVEKGDRDALAGRIATLPTSIQTRCL